MGLSRDKVYPQIANLVAKMKLIIANLSEFGCPIFDPICSATDSLEAAALGARTHHRLFGPLVIQQL